MTKIGHPRVVSRAEWLAARKELLIKGKEFTRARDESEDNRARVLVAKGTPCFKP